MSASGASFRCNALVWLAAVALASPGAAQPLELTRPTPEIAEREAPEGPPPEPAPQPEAQSSPDRTGIVVNILEQLSPDGYGPLDVRQGGLPSDMWKGAGWPVIRRLLPRAPGPTASGAARSLSSRLLRSRAILPPDKPADESYLGLRAGRLLAMADVAGALALMQAVPASEHNEAFLRTRLEALFLDNRSGEACADAAAGPRYRGTYWKQVEAFCLALNGDHPRATLISDLLREREEGIDPAFFAAMDRLAGLETTGVDAISDPDGLLLAMSRAASLQLPPEVADTDSPLVLRWVAQAPNVGLDARLAAAERALGLGVMEAEGVVGFYAGLPFTDEELRAPIGQAQERWGPRGRALLLSAAISRQSPVERAETLRQGWDIAGEKGGEAEFARASAAVVATIEPSPELVWFARSAARVLLRAGRIDDAMAWYRITVAERGHNAAARDAEADLRPLALVAGAAVGDGGGLPEGLRELLGGASRGGAAEAVAGGAALLTLLEANGHDIPLEMWREALDGPLASGGPALDAPWHRSLAAAAAAGRVGETVLLVAAAATAAQGRAYDHSGTAAAAVRALRRIGLDGDARRLSVESALAAGL